MSYYLLLFFIGFFGASLGSFFAVLVYRLPRNISLLQPSFCENCDVKIKPYNNIPILSFIFLLGKCKNCKKNIDFKNWFFEILFFILSIFLFLKYGFSVNYFIYFFWIGILVCIAFIDFENMFIPNILLLLLYIIGIFKGYFFGAILGFFLLFFINIISTFILRKTGKLDENSWAMGFGDAWLLGAIGLFLGFFKVFLVLFFGAAFGSLFGILFKKKVLAFGTFLSIAAIFISFIEKIPYYIDG